MYEALPIEHARRDDSFKLHGYGKRLRPRKILDMLNIIFQFFFHLRITLAAALLCKAAA